MDLVLNSLAVEKSAGGLLGLIIFDAWYANPPPTTCAVLLGKQLSSQTYGPYANTETTRVLEKIFGYYRDFAILVRLSA